MPALAPIHLKSNTITILPVLKGKKADCAACLPIRDRARHGSIPITLNDTGETIHLGATCYKRILTLFYKDNGMLKSRTNPQGARVPTGDIYLVRHLSIIDLSTNFPRSSLGIRDEERAFIKRGKYVFRMSAADLRTYLHNDIRERMPDKT